MGRGGGGRRFSAGKRRKKGGAGGGLGVGEGPIAKVALVSGGKGGGEAAGRWGGGENGWRTIQN